MSAQVMLGTFAAFLLFGAWLRVYVQPAPLARAAAAAALLGAVLVANFGAVQAYARVGKGGREISQYTAYSLGMMMLVFGGMLGCYAISCFPSSRKKAGWGGSLGLILLGSGALALVLQWHGLWFP